MAKKNKSKSAPKDHSSQSNANIQKDRPSLLELLERPRNIIIIFIALFFFIAIFYKPLAFDGLEVTGSDVVSGIGKTHQIKMFEQETGRRPLWNPYMFGGMPMYQRFGPVVWSLDVLLNQLDVLMDWRVWYFWAGAIGMFLLAKYLGLSAIVGFLAGIGFILMPHFQALIVVGHFAKFRALMWIPYILVTFLMLLNRRDLLSALLFTFAFSLQMRTQHYQIIFYTLLLLLFTGIVPYLRLAVEKRWGDFLKLNGLAIASIVLVVLIVAQPLFVMRDYTPYSTRGGNAISIEQTQTEQDKKGVGFDYATNWSYSISEFWNLIIPKFHGGASREVYTGDAVPGLKNREIPAYWGDLPFTQSYEYMGIILIFLAFVAILFRWQNPIVRSLTFLTLLSLILSLGKNFAMLYKLFFYYVPYFDKFRAPVMILTLVMFNVSVLAAFGLDFLLRADLSKKDHLKKLYVLSGVFGFLLLIPLLFGSSFSLSQPQELQRYTAQFGQEGADFVEALRRARLEILKSSALRTLFFFVVMLGFVYSLKQKWLPKHYAALGIVVLIGFDLGLISGNYLQGKFADLERIEQQTYRETAVDPIIKQDTSIFRVAPPLEQIGNDTRWCYHYQSVGGYSPAKLQLIQDLIENNIPRSVHPSLPFNLNIYSMLNVKYIVSSQRISHPALTFLGSDRGGDLNLFLNEAHLPRAFFVEETRVFADGVERLRFMNSPDFDPAKIALLEKDLPEPISAPDSSWARIRHFEPDKLVIEAYTDKKSLLVVSEVYYPRGWRAYLENGDELEIYKTNHILRSMVVPAGQHRITMEFKPPTYFAGVRLSLIGWLITYVGLAILLYRNYSDHIRGWARRKKND